LLAATDVMYFMTQNSIPFFDDTYSIGYFEV